MKRPLFGMERSLSRLASDPRVGRQVAACLRVRIGRVAELRVQDVRIGSAFKIAGERGRSGGRQQDLIGARALRFQDRESISHSVRRPLQRLRHMHPGGGKGAIGGGLSRGITRAGLRDGRLHLRGQRWALRKSIKRRALEDCDQLA